MSTEFITDHENTVLTECIMLAVDAAYEEAERLTRPLTNNN